MNLIKQLFHSRLLDMRLVIANSALRAYAPRWLFIISYPTSANGIIVNYSPPLSGDSCILLLLLLLLLLLFLLSWFKLLTLVECDSLSMLFSCVFWRVSAVLQAIQTDFRQSCPQADQCTWCRTSTWYSAPTQPSFYLIRTNENRIALNEGRFMNENVSQMEYYLRRI